MKSALFNVDKAYTHKVRQTKPFCFYQQTLFNKSTKTLGMNSLVFPLLCLLIYKYIVFICSRYICDALRHLVPFAKFKHEKHPWRSDTFSKVADLSLQLYWPQQPVTLKKRITPPWVFFTFFKLYIWQYIVQSATFNSKVARFLHKTLAGRSSSMIFS